MDSEIWIWLAIAAVTLISRLAKKRQKSANAPETPPVVEKNTTFEELLKELQEAKSNTDTPVDMEDGGYVAPGKDIGHKKPIIDYAPRQARPKVPELVSKYRPVATTPKRSEYEYVPELAPRQYLADNKAVVVKSRASMNLAKKDLRKEKARPALGFSASLNSTEGLKRAFVLSEILHRKY